SEDVMDKAQREDSIETQNEALKEAQNFIADQPILVKDTMKHMHAWIEDYSDNQYTNDEKLDNSKVEVSKTKLSQNQSKKKENNVKSSDDSNLE
ncbi:21094_t:CDS:1, partial [Gigaspora margarita]